MAFPDAEHDLELRNFIILDPQCAVDGIYQALDRELIVNGVGEISRQAFIRALEATGDYTRGESLSLFRLLQREVFGLCYSSPGNADLHVTPQFLSGEPKTLAFDPTLPRLHFRFT